MKFLLLDARPLAKFECIEGPLKFGLASSAAIIPPLQGGDSIICLSFPRISHEGQRCLEALLNRGGNLPKAHELPLSELTIFYVPGQVLPLEDERREQDLAPFRLQVSERVTHRLIILEIIPKFVDIKLL